MQIDKNYLAIVKHLLVSGFSPDRAGSDRQFPLACAAHYSKELPGLFDLLILYANPMRIVGGITQFEKDCLITEMDRIKKRVSMLAKDVPMTYFSLLPPDLQRLAEAYDFKHEDFLRECGRSI